MAAGWGTPSACRTVGATSASLPLASAHRRRRARVDRDERHGVGGVRHVRRAVGIGHLFQVAVVGGDQHDGVRGERGLHHLSQPRIHEASRTRAWPHGSRCGRSRRRWRSWSRSGRSPARSRASPPRRPRPGSARAPARRGCRRVTGCGRSSSPANGWLLPPLRKKVTCANFSDSATRSWRSPARLTISPRVSGIWLGAKATGRSLNFSW